MEFMSTRLGRIQYDARDAMLFPDGLIGFEELKLWVLLRDHALGWLQSLERAEVSLPVTNPFVFLPAHEVRIAAEDLEKVAISPAESPLVLAVVNHAHESWTLNLQAPILISPARRLGWQVVTLDEQPLRYALPRATVVLRKSA